MSNPNLLQREDFNRLILEIAPQVALAINRPQDNELYALLFQVIANWVPGYSGRKFQFAVTEYERMHLMMSLKFVSALFKAETLELFYIPLYR